MLGPPDPAKRVKITVDGRQMEAYEGEPILAALLAAGLHVQRYTRKRKEPRGFFCAVGRCTDCAMWVDGRPNMRTCVTPVSAGMVIRTQQGHGYWGTSDETDGCGDRGSGSGRLERSD